MSPPDRQRRPGTEVTRSAAADVNDPSTPEVASATIGAPTWHVEPYRGPYTTELGLLTVCPLHPWDAPNLSLVDEAAPVCFTTGHVWDEADALRAAR